MASAGAPSDSGYLRLVSAEKHVFIVPRRVALVSGFIRTMLSSSAFKEGKGEIELPEVKTAVLDHTIQCGPAGAARRSAAAVYGG